MIQLRCGYWAYQRAEESDDEGNIRHLPYVHPDIWLSIAKCFGQDWEGVVMLALITTRRRYLREENVIRLRDRLSSIKLPKMPWTSDPAQRSALRRIHMQWEKLPEAQQFMQLLRLLDDIEAT